MAAPRTSLRAAYCRLATFLRTVPCMSSAEALGSWEAFTRHFAVLRSEPAPSVPSSASAWQGGITRGHHKSASQAFRCVSNA